MIYVKLYNFLNFSVEKDNHHDNTAKTRDSQDCSQKVLELQKRLDQARAEVCVFLNII